MQIDHTNYELGSNQEYIVLSTSSGDGFAILDYSGTLHEIYRTNENNSRIKINMVSGAGNNLTADEIRCCPAGKNHAIFPNSFNKAFANYDSLESEWKFNGTRYSGFTSGARRNALDRTFPK